MVRAQNRTRATSVGGEFSHHCASPAPRDAVMLCRWAIKPQEFGVKRVDEGGANYHRNKNTKLAFRALAFCQSENI